MAAVRSSPRMKSGRSTLAETHAHHPHADPRDAFDVSRLPASPAHGGAWRWPPTGDQYHAGDGKHGDHRHAAACPHPDCTHSSHQLARDSFNRSKYGEWLAGAKRALVYFTATFDDGTETHPFLLHRCAHHTDADPA